MKKNKAIKKELYYKISLSATNESCIAHITPNNRVIHFH